MAALLGEVSEFLASGPMKLFIGGQWVDAVRTGPGQIAFTVIPALATSKAKVRVNPSRPCLDAA